MVHGTWYMVNDKMTIKQLSIFIENKGGTLIKVLDLLSKAGIQIIASTVADTKDYGIYRVLTNNPAQAYLILKDAGINVQLSEVFALSIDDQPGRAAETIKEISDELHFANQSFLGKFFKEHVGMSPSAYRKQ